MFNRTGKIRSTRARLQGEQLDITFPRRGRPSKFRRLERAGQMRLELQRPISPLQRNNAMTPKSETIDTALDYLFPVRPMTDDELTAEFHRLFD